MMSNWRIWAYVLHSAIVETLRLPFRMLGYLLIHDELRRLKGDIRAMIGAETQNVLNALSAATDAVAARIAALIAGMDLTAEEKAAFESVITNLQALATDPNNPTPPLQP